MFSRLATDSFTTVTKASFRLINVFAFLAINPETVLPQMFVILSFSSFSSLETISSSIRPSEIAVSVILSQNSKISDLHLAI